MMAGCTQIPKQHSGEEAIKLTADIIANYDVASNIGYDQFVGSTDELNEIIDLFMEDNSASDSMHLFFAANTAYKLNRPRDAMFLLYAAQLRKHLDYKRFELGDADGNNVETYLGYLNFGASEIINPLGMQHPALFSEAIRMIEQWEIVPGDDAYYPVEDYGEPKVSKSHWPIIANEGKQSFLSEFAYKMEKMIRNPQVLEAARFIQDYNFGKIPATPENDLKFKEYSELVDSVFESN